MTLTQETFKELTSRYRQAYGLPLFHIDLEGNILQGSDAWAKCNTPDLLAARVFAIQESWRWGESTGTLSQNGLIIWGVPLTINNELISGLISYTEEGRGAPINGDLSLRQSNLNVYEAGRFLREVAEEYNLTNKDALAVKRQSYEAEQQRAYVLHKDVGKHAAAIRNLYAREEPALFVAIRAGDSGEARKILNRVLVAIFHHGGNKLELLKGFLLELVASMFRSAIQAGAPPDQLFGDSFVTLSGLSKVQSLEAMADWTRRTLDQLIEVVPLAGETRGSDRVLKALEHMRHHAHTPLTLKDTAEVTGLSVSRFCAVLKEETGISFSTLLNRMRIDRSAVILRKADIPISEVAYQCGFKSQSYFTRVFKRERGCSPRAFRQQRS